MNVNFYYLAEPKTGGWVTYIIHMIRSMKAIGYNCNLIKIGKKEAKNQFFDGISIHTLPIEMAHLINKKTKSIIIAMELKEDAMKLGADLINNGADIIHHGMGQTPDDEFFASLKRKPKNYCVRTSIVEQLKKRGIDAIHLPQPFIYRALEDCKKSKAGVSLSRIDFVKKTELICKANQIDPLIDIYGSENGLYTSTILDKEFPLWRLQHKGEFRPLQGTLLAKPYRFLVDLTQIKNDGGEMQYTFMEAIVANCGLVLNRRWKVDGGIFTDENCHFVENANELVGIMRGSDLRNKDNFELLKDYEGTKVAKFLASTF